MISPYPEQQSDPTWIPVEIEEWTPELLRSLELDFGRRGYPQFCLEHRKWLEDMFDEQFRNPDYKPQYFDETEFDRIKRKRGLL